jgi:predicted TIM-barrel fold metal-dependent hydrolase
MKRQLLIILTIILMQVCLKGQSTESKQDKQIFDHHVHLMSPRMIKLFKDVKIPFSKPDADYSDIEAVSKRLGTNRFNLVSMAYLYGHPEFGKVENEYEAVKAENDYLVDEKKKSPTNIKAFCGVNPLKDYALQEVERCHKRLKTDGIKLHFNASQIYLTVPAHLKKVNRIFEYAAEKKIPILLHFDNLHPKFGERDVRLLSDEILAKIDGLNLQIAHFGTSGGFNQRTKAVIDAFIDQFEKNAVIKKHRIVFDISAVALDKDSEGIPRLTEEQFVDVAAYIRKLGIERLVFGTDYPLYSADEYIGILKDRVKLTDSEIRTLIQRP